jgi:ATP-dependent RNA helicase DDX5/DBP2
LAVQIADETEKLTKYSSDSTEHPSGLWTTCFYGGGKKQAQLKKFGNEGSHFVVATPGRLMDCIEEGSVSLQRVTYLCLDEADRMLDLGFLGDMEHLSSTIRKDKQMAFFSATWPKEVESLAYNLSTSGQPVTIRVLPKGKEDTDELVAAEGIIQEVVMIEELPGGKGMDKWGKQDEIKRKLLDAHLKKALSSWETKIMVFVNDKEFCGELAEKLYEEGYSADCIHGKRPQESRLRALDEFRQGNIRVLVATDVVGRGLDIPGITHVVVYSFGTPLEYVHRIGRTGRGVNGTGHALVFFEYTPKHTTAAEGLIDVLERSGQVVPDELRTIAQEVRDGIRVDFYKEKEKRIQEQNSSWNNWSSGDWSGKRW